MALREFYPSIDPHFQLAIAPLFPLGHTVEISKSSGQEQQATGEASVVEAASDMASPASDGLALDMDRAKQALLALLLENAFAGKMLAEQLADDGDESASANIVQDCDFVQLETAVALDHRPIHYLPTLLIKITEQLLPLSAGDPIYQYQLQQACRQLQVTRQKMIAANTGLVGFVAYKH